MTRLSTNSRLSYDPGHRETPIEGIGGMYRFWKSIDSKDRDKLVELFEFGHQDPGEDTPNTSRMDWQSLADQQQDAYENGYPGPVELMNQGWDYAIDDALNRAVQSPTERLVNQTRGSETEDEDNAAQPNGADEDNAAQLNGALTQLYDEKAAKAFRAQKEADAKEYMKEAEAKLVQMEEESRRAHARAHNWRVGNDDRWRMPLSADSDGNRLEWPTANTFDPDEYSAALARDYARRSR